MEFARRGPEAAQRVRDLAGTLRAALERAAELWIPPEVAKRLREASALCRSGADGGVTPELLEQLAALLAPILAPLFPERWLAQPVSRVPGIGPKTAQALARKEIATVEDLLFFLPRAYEDRREIVPIEKLEVGRSAAFAGTVTRSGVVPLRNGRRFFQAVVSDGTGAVQLKWFRGIQTFQDRLAEGVRVLVAGEVRRYRFAKELHHPDVEVLSAQTEPGELPRIVPSYSAVEGLPPRSLRRLVESALRSAGDLVDGWLPEATVAELGLAEIGAALREVHLPSVGLDPARLRERSTPYHLRLVAEELFLLQLGIALRRRELHARATEPLAFSDEAESRARAALPFALTGDQARAWREIRADLARRAPMNRLLIGDVGTGKTVLAVLAAAAAHASRRTTALLAPTELLAEQHFETLHRLASPLGLRAALLTGATPPRERAELARWLERGEVALVVGTHALFSESVDLPRLGLVVIDEQHRFGVAQRRALARKGENPHLLAMSATPIPRTLALTVFGDLDHSTLRERPPGRSPVETRVVPPTAGRTVMAQVHETLKRGEQIFVVYPLVEESEKADLKDATRGFERLRKALPGISAALVHGRLERSDRARAMSDFAAGRVKILVATTVIEVGVDVPNATLLIVQHAERFGLAQLHQLRGRVGRGGRPGRALLIADPTTPESVERLAILERSESGFEIAEADLRIRGAGEWLGTRQAGHLPELRLADLVRHGDFLDAARDAAAALVARDPRLDSLPGLRDAVARRWGARLELAAAP
ncbi:MAG: ATP-dependent DNA helicase RecG [Myxococcota bacterium]